MEEEKKDVIEENKRKKNITKKMRENLWMVSSFVLGIFVLVILINSFFGNLTGNLTGNIISEKEIGEQALAFFNSQLSDSPAEIVSVEEVNGVYKVLFSLNKEKFPLYFTKDGKWINSGMELMSILPEDLKQLQQQEQPSQPAKEVSKSDKPVVEAFVFSYCPYGLQFQKALAPVYNLLKNKADINLVAIGAMHGEHEKQESIRQICIQKEYNKDKLWAYLEKFMNNTQIGDCNNNMQCSAPLIEAIMKGLSIDVNKINSCMSGDGQNLYSVDNSKASGLGVSGSPTFMINGAQVSVARTPENIKQAVCDAFTTAPEECNQKLSTSSASPWFGDVLSSASSSASC